MNWFTGIFLIWIIGLGIIAYCMLNAPLMEDQRDGHDGWDQGASTGIGEEDDQDDLDGLAAKDGILSCDGVWEAEL